MAFLGTFTNRIGEVATLTDNTTAESRKSTATYTPAADNLQIATFLLTGTITTDPVVTGCGLTWVLIRREQQSANASRCLAVYRAMGTGSSGAVTVTRGVGTDTFSRVHMHVVEVTEVLTSGTNGSGAIAQNVQTNITTTATPSQSITMVDSANNALYGAFSYYLGVRDFTAGTGYTELAETDQAGDSTLATEYRTDSDTNVDGTWSSSAATTIIALEIVAALTGPTITVQPANDVGIISNGQSTVYTATATGTNVDAPTWYEDGSPIADGGVYDIVTTGAGTSSCSSTLTITRTVKTGTPFDIKANFADDNGNTDTSTVTDTWWTGPVLTTFPATNGSGVSTATLTCDYVTGVGEAIEVRIPLNDGDVAVTVTTT